MGKRGTAPEPQFRARPEHVHRHSERVEADPARTNIGPQFAAIRHGCHAVTLEVRVSNSAAQAMYRRFGFQPAGVRARYYENTEDAIVMWAHDVDRAPYLERLAAIEEEIPGRTVSERLA